MALDGFTPRKTPHKRRGAHRRKDLIQLQGETKNIHNSGKLRRLPLGMFHWGATAGNADTGEENPDAASEGCKQLRGYVMHA